MPEKIETSSNIFPSILKGDIFVGLNILLYDKHFPMRIAMWTWCELNKCFGLVWYSTPLIPKPLCWIYSIIMGHSNPLRTKVRAHQYNSRECWCGPYVNMLVPMSHWVCVLTPAIPKPLIANIGWHYTMNLVVSNGESWIKSADVEPMWTSPFISVWSKHDSKASSVCCYMGSR